jgi:hypothetical protein
MPTTATILAAIRIVSSPTGQFTTFDVIKHLLGAYYSNVATPPCYSYNAKVGKLIATIPNIQNLGEINVRDKNNRKSTSAKWKI